MILDTANLDTANAGKLIEKDKRPVTRRVQTCCGKKIMRPFRVQSRPALGAEKCRGRNTLSGRPRFADKEAHLVVRDVGGWIAHRQNRALLNGVAPWIELDLEVAGEPCALARPLPHILLLLLRPVEFDVGKDHCLIWRRQPRNAQRHLHEMKISSIHKVQRLYRTLACPPSQLPPAVQTS